MTARLLRVALDTNMFVSTIISASSVPAEAIAKALQTATVLVSLETWDEIEEVLMREKFDRYQAAPFRRAYLDFLRESRDKDLLVLGPFEGIPIITPLDYLAH